MRKIWWLLLTLLTVALARGPLPAAGGETGRLEALENMTPEAKEKFYAKKVKDVEGYAQSQIGRFIVNSAFGAESSCYWGAVFDDFANGVLNEGLYPKKVRKSTLTAPIVYLAKDRPAFTGAMARWGERAPKVADITTRHVPKAKADIVFTWKFSDNEQRLRTSLMREASHVMLSYHVSHDGPPGWFREGVASNLETFEPWRRMKANLFYGVYMTGRASFLAGIKPTEIVPFSHFINMHNAEWGALSDTARLNESSAWLVVNYFLTTRR